MRWFLAAIFAILLAPSVSAASQVHVTYLGDAYAVTFVSNATGASVPVTWEGGQAFAARVPASDGDGDRIFRAEIPARAIRYTIEGRTFALPAPPGADETARIVFVADIGSDANASAVVRAILREKPSLVLIGGDLSYANGNASVWNGWFELMEPLMANVPTMPAYGNHEDYCTREDGSLYHCGPEPNGWHAHFALPSDGKLYYAFDWGPLRITSLDTEAYVSDDATTDADAQEEFLDDSLEAADGLWNVVMYHRPLRTTNAKEGLQADGAREALEPLLDGRADLVLQAHAHAYERAKPQNGTTYVTSGGGGRPLYPDWNAEEPWLETRAAELHFLVLDASPTRISLRAVRPDGSTLDAFSLARDVPSRLSPPTAGPSPGAGPSIATPSANAPSTPDGAASVGESSTPGPGLLALVLVLTLSGRLTRRPSPG